MINCILQRANKTRNRISFARSLVTSKLYPLYRYVRVAFTNSDHCALLVFHKYIPRLFLFSIRGQQLLLNTRK